MKRNRSRKKFLSALLLFALFILFTLAVKTVDVQPIGPEGSYVGFATVNNFFFRALGSSDFFYTLTKLLGYLAFLVVGAFALLGLYQLIERKSIKKVDYRILLLAGFYVLVAIFYVAFEKIIINYRPMILDESVGLEASYPSSHTMMLLCIMASARYLLHRMYKASALCGIGSAICIVMMVIMPVGRLLSGVHWFTDIVGACLLSAALVKLYEACVYAVGRKLHRQKKAARRA